MNLRSRSIAFGVTSLVCLACGSTVAADGSGSDRVHPTDGDQLDRAIISPVSRIGGISRALAVDGDHAFLGVGSQLVVIDLSNAFSPRAIGKVELMGEPSAIAVSGNRLFAVTGATVAAVDLTDLARPRVLATYSTNIELVPVVGVHNEHVYVLSRIHIGRTSSHTLHILDASEPVTLTHLAQYSSPGSRHMIIRDSLMFMGYATGDTRAGTLLGAVRIYDLSDPLNPTPIGNTPSTNEIVGIHVSDGFLYAAVDLPGRDSSDEHSGLRVYDLLEPSAPRLVGSLITSAGIKGLIVAGQRVYLREVRGYSRSAERSELLVSISSPTQPTSLGRVALPTNFEAAAVRRFRLLAAGLHGGLDVFDIGDPADPRELPGWDAHAGAADVAVGSQSVLVPSGNAQVATEADSVSIFGRHGGRVLPVVGGWVSAGASLAAMDGSLAILAAPWGMQTVDLEDPAQPTELGRMEQNWRATRLLVSNGRAYVNSAEGLYVVDVSDPGSLAIVGHVSYAGVSEIDAGGMAVDECLALAALGAAGLAAIDLCSAGAPRLLARHQWSGRRTESTWVKDVAIHGSLAFVVANDHLDSNGRLLVLDASEPTSSNAIGSLLTTAGYEAIDVAGQYAFVAGRTPKHGAGWPAWVAVIDVSDPPNVCEVQRVAAPGTPSRVVVDGNNLFVAAGTSGLHVMQLLPPNFRPIATIYLPSAVHHPEESAQSPTAPNLRPSALIVPDAMVPESAGD